jgi:ribonuclease D
MTHPALPEPTLVETPPHLRLLAERLRDAPLLAVDTESNSLYAYRERVCLIQISTPLMASPQLEKVFHAAEYDIMCLKRDFGWEFANLFDTMIAARILGWSEVGLGSLLKKEFGVRLNKRHQRANWGERPLPRDRLLYAQMDTHYLPALRDRLAAALRAGGHWEEAQESFGELLTLPPAEHRFDPEGFWRVNGGGEVPRRKMALARELYLFREETARQRDRPPFKIFGEATLVELALKAPHTLEELRRVHGMTSGQVRRYGRGILQALQRGERSRAPRPPRRGKPPTAEVLARHDALHTWRRDRASARGVKSDVIVSREALWALARQAPQTMDDLKCVAALGPWKRRTYGAEILQVLRLAGGSRPPSPTD